MTPSIERLTPSEYFYGKSKLPNYSEEENQKILYIQSLLESASDNTLKLEQVIHSVLGNHDISTESHSFSTASICHELFLQLDTEFSEHLAFESLYKGAMFHDVGKALVCPNILNKAQSLTVEEVQEIKKHPLNSYEILYPAFKNDPIILDIALYHHEKWNGQGYPYGLSGNQIPKAARIFAIVDVWESLTSDRPYREHMTYKEAITLMMSPKFEGNFDPEIFQHFLEIKSYLFKR